MKSLAWLAGAALLAAAAAAQPAAGPGLKEPKLFAIRYEGKTLSLKKVDYLHKVEQQHGRYTFHVSEKGAFVLMLKEVVKDGGLAMVTSQALAEKLVKAELKGLPSWGQGWYKANLAGKVEKVTVGGSSVWVMNVTRFDFLDRAGKVATAVK
jgi:hypothetical protein